MAADMNDRLRRGILETAAAIGANPLDLATAISYETAGTFDPMKRGPTTQYGQHRGLIQFGEPQARQHGVDWNDPIGSQLGPNGAIASYFRSSGFKPGMSGLDLYSTINAGAPGKYGASDANNGGAPGSVRDKWDRQMGSHRQKASALLGDILPGQSSPQLAGTPAPALGPTRALSDAQIAQAAPAGAAFGDVVAPRAAPGFGDVVDNFMQRKKVEAEKGSSEQARRAAIASELAKLYG